MQKQTQTSKSKTSKTSIRIKGILSGLALLIMILFSPILVTIILISNAVLRFMTLTKPGHFYHGFKVRQHQRRGGSAVYFPARAAAAAEPAGRGNRIPAF